MAVSSEIVDICDQIYAHVLDRGSIDPTWEESVGTLLGQLEELTGVTFLIDGNLYITYDRSPLKTEAQMLTLLSSSQYFKEGDVQYGVLSSTGGEKLQDILQSATTATFQSATAGTHQYSLRSASCRLVIQEYDASGETPIYPNILVYVGGEAGYYIPIFQPKDHLSSWTALKYEVAKSETGDFIFKAYTANDDTEPDPETASELFDQFSILSFTVEKEASEEEGKVHYSGHWDRPTGTDELYYTSGFLFAEFSQRYNTSHYTETEEATPVNGDGYWGCVFFNKNGAPLYVTAPNCSYFTEKYASSDDLSPSWSDSAGDSVCLAPIFTPSSGVYASEHAGWLIMAKWENSVYTITGLSASSYRCDHGICMEGGS